MLTADQIIDALGGTSAVASALSLTPSTVHSWREVNFIPVWRQGEILIVAEKLEIKLSPADFPSPLQRRPRTPVTKLAKVG